MHELVTLIVLVLMVVEPHVEGGSVNTHHPVRADMENDSRCFRRYSWTSRKIGYRMVCFECQQKIDSVIIYHENTPLFVVRVEMCSYLVPESISIGDHWYDAENGEVFIIEYVLTSGACARVFVKGGGERLAKEECPEVRRRWDKKMVQRHLKTYVNNWKEEDLSLAGVVKGFPASSSNKRCELLRKWVHFNKKVTMKCMECGDKYVVFINGGDNTMEAVEVGSCLTPYLENSIRLVRGNSDLEYRVHYLLTSNSCVTKKYTRTPSTGFTSKQEPQCSYKSRPSVGRLAGYRNNWKNVNLNNYKGSIIENNLVIDENYCKLLHTWEHVVTPIKMKCYLCPGVAEFVVYLYHGTEKMDNLISESCASPQLENSVDFRLVEAKGLVDHEYRVEYWVPKSFCFRVYYSRPIDKFVSHSGDQCVMDREDDVEGYTNRWKMLPDTSVIGAVSTDSQQPDA